MSTSKTFSRNVRQRLLGFAGLCTGLALLAVPVLLNPSVAHSQTPSVRKSVTDLTPAEAMSLRRGVAKMMSRNSAPRGSDDFRRSWLYWANIHLHFGQDCAGPIVGTGMSGVQTYVATNADEQATWCSCEHGTVQFLTWHRMYLWYFEHVLQEAAQDTSLRLPYWDYESDGHLPAIYRDKTYVNENGQTVANPLRVEARQPGLNDGTAALSTGATATKQAMGATSFNPFSTSLEKTPHGAVHCAIVPGGCPNGLMGSVPVAALDPIFYAHHTNLDRLYECWLHVDEGKRLPSDAGQLDTSYTFVDGPGGMVARQVKDMLTLAQLKYSYGSGGGCPQQPVVAVAQNVQLAVTPANEQVLASSGPTGLRASTTVALQIAPQERHALSAMAVVPSPRHIYATIEGLQYDEAPGAMYNVFLQNADGKREQVGIINFFGIAPSSAAAAPQGKHHVHARQDVRFDVTQAVQQLGTQPDKPLAIVFEATTGLAGETGVPEVKAGANVRFDSMRLTRTP